MLVVNSSQEVADFNFVYPVAARSIVIILFLSKYLNSSHYNNVLAAII